MRKVALGYIAALCAWLAIGVSLPEKAEAARPAALSASTKRARAHRATRVVRTRRKNRTLRAHRALRPATKRHMAGAKKELPAISRRLCDARVGLNSARAEMRASDADPDLSIEHLEFELLDWPPLFDSERRAPRRLRRIFRLAPREFAAPEPVPPPVFSADPPSSAKVMVRLHPKLPEPADLLA